MRTDQPRQTGMDYWKGPHSKIISRDPGLGGVPPDPPGRGQPGAVAGHPTASRPTSPSIARSTASRRSPSRPLLSPLLGRKQTRLAYKDEINVFRRTLLYAGPPNSARWYDVAGPAEKAGARALIYLRRRDGVGTGAFRKFITDELVPALASTGRAEGTANPGLHALEREALGHPERRARQPRRPAVPRLADPRLHRHAARGGHSSTATRSRRCQSRLPAFASAIHAYEVPEALTYVKDGKVLPHHQT